MSNQQRHNRRSRSRKPKTLNTWSRPKRPINRVWKLFESGTVQWIQGSLALNVNGQLEDVRSKDVVGCCVIGAIHRVYGKGLGSLVQLSDNIEPEIIVRKLAHHLGEPELWKWNDAPHRTINEILHICKELNI